MARSETVRNGFGIDTRDMKAFTRALRKASPAVARDMRRHLREAGELVAGEARKRAEEHSQSIASTIKVRTAGATVAVVAGGPDAPLAALYEIGNKGGGSGSTFRHPVYGHNDQPWVEQPRFPFLAPSAAEKSAEVLDLVGETLDEAAKTISFE